VISVYCSSNYTRPSKKDAMPLMRIKKRREEIYSRIELVFSPEPLFYINFYRILIGCYTSETLEEALSIISEAYRYKKRPLNINDRNIEFSKKGSRTGPRLFEGTYELMHFKDEEGNIIYSIYLNSKSDFFVAKDAEEKSRPRVLTKSRSMQGIVDIVREELKRKGIRKSIIEPSTKSTREGIGLTLDDLFL